MTHFGAYWKFFDRRDELRCVTPWRVRLHSRLADAVKNDVLWLFTSGEKSKKKLSAAQLPPSGAEDSLACLVEVFTVRTVVRDEVGPFTWRVDGIDEKCLDVTPLLIDDLVRPDGWDRATPIGALRQGAWVLPEPLVDLLQSRLLAQRLELHQRHFG
jgi:hypothetical protein